MDLPSPAAASPPPALSGPFLLSLPTPLPDGRPCSYLSALGRRFPPLLARHGRAESLMGLRRTATVGHGPAGLGEPRLAPAHASSGTLEGTLAPPNCTPRDDQGPPGRADATCSAGGATLRHGPQDGASSSLIVAGRVRAFVAMPAASRRGLVFLTRTFQPFLR